MSPTVDRSRTLRGAVCGAVAASVWALQQPLDKRAFRCGYDDVELLGRAVSRREDGSWYPIGLAMHIQNGALFGAVYANVAPALPLPAVARGPALALAEHIVLWPLTRVTDRFHPARNDLPTLSGSRNAFWQAAWRHLMFGLVVGELDRRLSPPPESETPEPEADYSSNGHGSLEHAMSAETT